MSTPEYQGTDNRPHHKWGFSFVKTLELCPAAERASEASDSLAVAAERGTELHELLELSVKAWLANVEKDPKTSISFRDVVAAKAAQLNTYDMKSVMKIVDDIEGFFTPDPNLLVGTEERINLNRPDTTSEVGIVNEKDILSYGYYDIVLMFNERALVIDHKFVRKEVDAAEKNRQGHCLAVAIFQNYPKIETVEVMFTMPECGTSRHTFTRTDDFKRIEAELEEIFDAADRPFKTLRTGDHCTYCRHKANCAAVTQNLETMATAIVPLSKPKTFDIAKVTDPEEMTLIRYWCSVLEPAIEQFKKAATEMAKQGKPMKCIVNGEVVEYKITERKGTLKIKDTIDFFNAVSGWLPVEQLLAACTVKIGELRKNVTQVGAQRLLDEGKKPNMRQIQETFDQWLLDSKLAEETAGSTYLMPVKAGGAAKANTVAKRLREATSEKRDDFPTVEEAQTNPF